MGIKNQNIFLFVCKASKSDNIDRYEKANECWYEKGVPETE
jgi:hypothetical protein